MFNVLFYYKFSFFCTKYISLSLSCRAICGTMTVSIIYLYYITVFRAGWSNKI